MFALYLDLTTRTMETHPACRPAEDGQAGSGPSNPTACTARIDLLSSQLALAEVPSPPSVSPRANIF